MATSMARESADEQRPSPVDADLRRQQIHHRDVGGAEQKLDDDRRQREEGNDRGDPLSR
jgi:hypothetical protein